jgi:hypothetical protein
MRYCRHQTQTPGTDCFGIQRFVAKSEASQMRRITVILATITIGLFMSVSVRTQASQGWAARKGERAKVARLWPAADSEVVLDEMWLTTDATGRRMVTMTSPLKNDHLTNLIWVVDVRTSRYNVVRLTNNDRDDAERLQKIYRRLGVSQTLESLEQQITSQRVSSENRSLAMRRKYLTRRTAIQSNEEPPTAPAAQCPDGSQADFVDSVVVSDSIETGAPAEQGSTCRGFAWANVQTWEPARYLFNVNHLNETDTEASWTHSVPGNQYTVTDFDRFCWANPETFAGTHWYQQECIPSSNYFSNSFDISTTGHYVNFDFSFYAFGTYRPVWITATASVGSWYGQHQIGLNYIEDVADWIRQYYETFLLTGRLTGDGFEGWDCQSNCQPDPGDVFECEHRMDYFYWDYEQCACIGGASPILIDFDGDGLALTNATDGVRFDVLASGGPVQVAWTKVGANDGFLALDRNGNGVIDGGAELFGNHTEQPEPNGRNKKTERNGFLALAVFDRPSHGGNGDGQITEEDAEFSRMVVWIDANHDGVSQASEMNSLGAFEIRAVSLHYVTQKTKDQFGNAYRFRSRVVMDKDAFAAGPFMRRAVDVFLTYIQ